MALHATPEQHAANPPESWRIVRVPDRVGSHVWWHLFIEHSTGDSVQSYSTRREATAALTSGFYFDLYRKEGRWFAGEEISGWRSYAEIQAEKAAR